VEANGSSLRLKDVARIEMGAQSYGISSRFNREPAANIAVYQLPGSNAVAGAEAVRERLNELKKRFPKDLDFRVAIDTTRAVRSGISEIEWTLVIALLLVVLVVYIFLQSWRATLIPMLAVPVSLIGPSRCFRFSVSRSTRCRCSGWCWPSGWWWTTPSWWWRPSSITWPKA